MLRATLLLATCVIGNLLLVGCKESNPPDDRKWETKVVCAACGEESTLKLNAPVKDETWPKECPSCKKATVYACVTCTNCGTTILLKDPQTDGYGRPELCPKCGLPWEK
jgi:predicted RNA-binding Zn-ribbon protein involved in translation (DUF1610 family)